MVRKELGKQKSIILNFQRTLKPWHHVRQCVVYITDRWVAFHKHLWKFHFSTCHFATAGMLGFFFISPILIQNSWVGWLWIPIFLSRKHPILLFFPHFEELDIETQWKTELRELISASDRDLSCSESGWSCAEMNIINIPSLNAVPPFVKGKKTLDLWSQNLLWISGHW